MVIVKKFLLKNRLYFIIGFCILFIFILYFFLFSKRIIFKENLSDLVIDVNSNFTPQGVSACYGNMFKCRGVDVSLYNEVDTSLIGDYQVKYVASYGKHKKTLINHVKVVDNVSPIIEASDEAIYVCPGSDKYDIKYSASDNYDGDLSDRVSMDVSDNSITLNVSDSSGNKVSKVIELRREDITNPVISLEGSDIYIPVGSSYNEPGYSASDNCDGDITNRVAVSGSVSNDVGKYVINYSVTDSSGNSSSIDRSVNVYSPNNNGNKVIYLTFDDGPSQYTSELLDILDRYNVKVTFFVTGRNPGYSYLIGEAFRRGHSIGLHTNTHNYSYVYSSIDAYFEDLNAINEIVNSQTGSYSNIIRFPGGSSNTVSRNYSSGIMSQLASMVEARGFKYYDWNVSSGDASGTIMDSSQYASNVINGLGNGSSYVVLQHDTNINSIRAVSSIIEYGLSHGYSFGTLDINGPIIHHRIAN